MLVEGVNYRINWRAFKRGTSIFIPCLDCTKSKETILRTTKRLKLSVFTKVVIVDGIRGLRIWHV